MWCLWYNENVLLIGRPYGGCSFLYKKSLGPSIICIDVGRDRVCCIKLNTKFGMLYIFNVYMSCDTTSNDHIEEYNYVLSCISTCLYQNEVEYCIIAGDLNTDLIRHSSGNTISLHSFIEHEHLAYVLKLISNNVYHTFTSIKYTKSLIDHFIISQSLSNCIIDYYTLDSIDNLSDHIPLFCILYCTIDRVMNTENHNKNSTLRWDSATDEQITYLNHA